MPYLHLPVQSGSDRILRLMNRKHGRQKYFDLIGRIREARPDMAMSGDFIVGFPGETDRGFRGHAGSGAAGRLRLGLLLHVFAAPRHARRDHGRPGPGRGRRETGCSALQALLFEQQTAFNAAQAGQDAERPVRAARAVTDGQAIGRSPIFSRSTSRTRII